MSNEHEPRGIEMPELDIPTKEDDVPIEVIESALEELRREEKGDQPGEPPQKPTYH